MYSVIIWYIITALYTVCVYGCEDQRVEWGWNGVWEVRERLNYCVRRWSSSECLCGPPTHVCHGCAQVLLASCLGEHKGLNTMPWERCKVILMNIAEAKQILRSAFGYVNNPQTFQRRVPRQGWTQPFARAKDKRMNNRTDIRKTVQGDRGQYLERRLTNEWKHSPENGGTTRDTCSSKYGRVKCNSRRKVNNRQSNCRSGWKVVGKKIQEGMWRVIFVEMRMLEEPHRSSDDQQKYRREQLKPISEESVRGIFEHYLMNMVLSETM